MERLRWGWDTFEPDEDWRDDDEFPAYDDILEDEDEEDDQDELEGDAGYVSV